VDVFISGRSVVCSLWTHFLGEFLSTLPGRGQIMTGGSSPIKHGLKTPGFAHCSENGCKNSGKSLPIIICHRQLDKAASVKRRNILGA